MKTVLLLLFVSIPAFAHHGPDKALHHEKDPRIEVLTTKISTNPTANLLTVRAKVYLELGRTEEARHDLEHALMLNNDYQPAKTLISKLMPAQ